jgi:hypothetical protein
MKARFFNFGLYLNRSWTKRRNSLAQSNAQEITIVFREFESMQLTPVNRYVVMLNSEFMRSEDNVLRTGSVMRM